MAPAIIAAIIGAASSLFGRIASAKSKKKNNSDIYSAIGSSVANLATSIGGSITQKNLISQQNAFNAAEAQKAREWNLQMDASKYQRAVTDMQAAGVNPALAIDGHLSTQATSNAQAQQTDSGLNAMTALASIFSNAELKNKEMALKNKELEQVKVLKNRELDIAQQNADTQAGVGAATAENQAAMAEATRIANKYADEKNKLMNDFLKHQVSYEEYIAKLAKIDYEIKEATKDTEIAIKAQELVNMEALNGLYLAQINELSTRSDLNVSEKEYTDLNKDLLQIVKADKQLENSYNTYAYENGLPTDHPTIVMAYRQADLNEQYWKAQGDEEQAQAFAKVKADIRKTLNKVASGRMTNAEATKFYVTEGRAILGDIAKGVGFYAGMRKGGVPFRPTVNNRPPVGQGYKIYGE